ncbi:hypothetical protein DAPPUDRAFT_41247 [Daphnia pulex]|uniref:Uncharacterized protein n=1 Tax=Daphnia pulex TaxID=6669 RepID=E9FVA4_DAPPU|nr:UPF0538 protein C2orf76 homolog [Daphnia pulicaria]EFX88526.1 hypothetical protein DAPPUDRAFT_41247 [Daphnia pulex]|eukprot:EFX88526.1 hypothetical protein DAPPUDRAFT_41247 [Daphnia pulex]
METATIIIRVIRSFEYRNIRNVVLKNVPLSLTTEELKTRIIQELGVAPGLPPPFRKYEYDTLKIEHHAHGAKTNDPVINHENDEGLILKAERTLKESDVRHETEISFFKYDDYMSYKKNPVLKIGSR